MPVFLIDTRSQKADSSETFLSMYLLFKRVYEEDVWLSINTFWAKFVVVEKKVRVSLLERKNDLTMRIAFICWALCLPYYFIFDYFGLSFAKSFVIPTVLIYVLAMGLNALKWHTTSKWLLVLGTSGSLFFYANVLGDGAGAQLLLFALVPLPLLLFNITQFGWILGSVRRYELRLEAANQALFSNNVALEESNSRLQIAYEDLQAQQNLLEKTWQEYGFTSKLSGTLRLSEIVDLTAKTILQHFGLRYVATVSSGDTSTLETWTLDNGLPLRTRQDIFESQICYTYEKGPILHLSAAHLSRSVLEILDPIPVNVLHLAITERESRYILIGPKTSELVFSDLDLKLLQALSTQATTALQRALPYEDAVHRYGLAIKQESAYQMLVSLQHQINSPLSAAKMAMDTLSKTQMEDNIAVISKMGKEALDSVVAVMRRMRQISQLKETTYLGDIKMWDIGDQPISSLPQGFMNV